MYKRGMNDTLGSVFEHPVNYIQFYETFTHEHAFFREVLENQAAYPKEKLEEYKHKKLKNFEQFLDDSKPLLISQTEGKVGQPNHC